MKPYAVLVRETEREGESKTVGKSFYWKCESGWEKWYGDNSNTQSSLSTSYHLTNGWKSPYWKTPETEPSLILFLSRWFRHRNLVRHIVKDCWLWVFHILSTISVYSCCCFLCPFGTIIFRLIWFYVVLPSPCAVLSKCYYYDGGLVVSRLDECFCRKF